MEDYKTIKKILAGTAKKTLAAAGLCAMLAGCATYQPTRTDRDLRLPAHTQEYLRQGRILQDQVYGKQPYEKKSEKSYLDECYGKRGSCNLGKLKNEFDRYLNDEAYDLTQESDSLEKHRINIKDEIDKFNALPDKKK